MAVNAYLYFNGNCREAVEYYSQVFDAEKPQFMTYGQVPSNPDYAMPVQAKDLVMHTQLTIGGSRVMFSDVFPGTPFVAGNNVMLAFVSSDAEQIRTYFGRLKAGGTVEMELQETFWSKSYGSLTDKFGVKWLFNHDKG